MFIWCHVCISLYSGIMCKWGCDHNADYIDAQSIVLKVSSDHPYLVIRYAFNFSLCFAACIVHFKSFMMKLLLIHSIYMTPSRKHILVNNM